MVLGADKRRMAALGKKKHKVLAASGLGSEVQAGLSFAVGHGQKRRRRVQESFADSNSALARALQRLALASSVHR